MLGVMAPLPKSGGELRAGSAGSSLLFLALLECCFSTLLFCLRSLSTWTVLGNAHPGLAPPAANNTLQENLAVARHSRPRQ